MNLAEVLGLNDRVIQEKKLLETKKVVEILELLLAQKHEVEKKDPNFWVGISSRIGIVEQKLDNRDRKESLKDLIVILRQIANDINEFTQNKRIQFDQNDQLSKSCLTELEVFKERRDKLVNKLKEYEQIVLGMLDGVDTDPRVDEIHSTIKRITLNTENAASLQDVLLCEDDAKQIWSFKSQISAYDPKVYAEQLEQAFERLKAKADRRNHAHKLQLDTAAIQTQLNTINDPQAMEFDVRLALKMGLKLCNDLDSQLLDSKHLKLPRVDKSTLQTKLEAIVNVLTCLDGLQDKITQEFSATPLEAEESNALILPKLAPLVDTAKQSLEETKTSLEQAVMNVDKLSQQTTPLDEREVNTSCIRLAISIKNAQTQLSTNPLLSHWDTCAFYQGQPNLNEIVSDIF